MSFRDRVQVFKDESVAGGGTAGDAEPYPTTINPSQDAIECAGVVLNDWNAGTPIQDTSTTIERVGNDMKFKDSNNTTPITLTALKNGAAADSAYRRHFLLMGA